eukprot:SAG31_NODE_15952_length_730_cov_0.717908_1_plen_65_part_00
MGDEAYSDEDEFEESLGEEPAPASEADSGPSRSTNRHIQCPRTFTQPSVRAMCDSQGKVDVVSS